MSEKMIQISLLQEKERDDAFCFSFKDAQSPQFISQIIQKKMDLVTRPNRRKIRNFKQIISRHLVGATFKQVVAEAQVRVQTVVFTLGFLPVPDLLPGRDRTGRWQNCVFGLCVPETAAASEWCGPPTV